MVLLCGAQEQEAAKQGAGEEGGQREPTDRTVSDDTRGKKVAAAKCDNDHSAGAKAGANEERSETNVNDAPAGGDEGADLGVGHLGAGDDVAAVGLAQVPAQDHAGGDDNRDAGN